MVDESEHMGGWGWRGILGYICPAIAGWNEEYFYRVVPPGVGMMMITLGLSQATSEERAKEAVSGVGVAARKLAMWGANAIHVSGGPLAFAKGRDGDKQLIKEIEDIAKVPATTSHTDVVAALKALSIKKLIIVDPFIEDVGAKRKRFFSKAGFDVVKVKSVGIGGNIEVRKLPLYAPYVAAKEAILDAPQADGVYLACGAWAASAAAECLEKDFGKPVVTGYQAFIWAGLKTLHIKEPAKGPLRLFQVP